jgi:hypothetical protein
VFYFHQTFKYLSIFKDLPQLENVHMSNTKTLTTALAQYACVATKQPSALRFEAEE